MKTVQPSGGFLTIQYDTLEAKNDIARDFEAVDQQYQDLEVLVRGQDNQQYLFEMTEMALKAWTLLN